MYIHINVSFLGQAISLTSFYGHCSITLTSLIKQKTYTTQPKPSRKNKNLIHPTGNQLKYAQFPSSGNGNCYCTTFTPRENTTKTTNENNNMWLKSFSKKLNFALCVNVQNVSTNSCAKKLSCNQDANPSRQTDGQTLR